MLLQSTMSVEVSDVTFECTGATSIPTPKNCK